MIYILVTIDFILFPRSSCQRLAQLAQPGLVAVAFFLQPRIRIGCRFMRLVALFLAFEVDRGVALAVARRRSATNYC